MLNYRFTLNDKDITDKLLGVSYSENLEDVASSFSFTSLEDFDITSLTTDGKTRINTFKIYEKTQTKPFYIGVVTDYEHTTDVNVYSYSGYDVGFYLNKNEVIKQFKKANIGKAIESLCTEFNISATMPEFKATVSKIYKDVVLADILKELLELERLKTSSKDLYIDCKNGKLNITRYQIEQNLTALIGSGFLVGSDSTYSNCSVKKSIQELKNRVIYSDNNEKSLKRITADDTNSIATYGLLTAVETVDTNKQNNLKQLAKTKLTELNKIKTEISKTLIADHRVSKGKLIDFTNADYGLTGIYLVKSANHEITAQKETVSVSIEKYLKT